MSDLNLRLLRADQFDRLAQAVKDFVAIDEPTHRDWERLKAVYASFRSLYVGDKPKAKLDDLEGAELAQGRAALEAWLRGRADFFALFSSQSEAVRGTLGTYRKIQRYFSKQTARYKEQAAEYSRKRAKKLGLNKTPEAKASKAAWASSPEGQAWWAAYRSKRNEKRAEKIAKEKEREAEKNRITCKRCAASVPKGRKLCDLCLKAHRRNYAERAAS